MVLLTLKWVCIPYLLQIFLMLLHRALGVWYDYMTLGFDIIGSGLGAWIALTVSPITNLTGWLGKPFLHLVQGPFGVFTMGDCLPEMLHFFLEYIRFVTYSQGRNSV